MTKLIVWFSLLAPAAWGLDNAVRITDRTGSAQTNRPFTIAWAFAEDEICDFPQPFTGGTGIAIWQADNVNRWPASALCPAGSVKRADISFRATVPANGTLTVDFRNNADPCSSGNRAACDAAGLDQAGMLGFNGGAWGGEIRVTANPQGPTTQRGFDPRAVLAAGQWRYRMRGPAATQVVLADETPARSRDFGFKEKRVARLTTLVGSDWTSLGVEDVSALTGLTRPFLVEVDGENISICYISGTTLYVGTTNGTSSSCQNVAGRGQNGTTPAAHSVGIHGNMVRLPGDLRLTATIDAYALAVPVTDASGIDAPEVFQVGSEMIRVCNKSGNVLTVGTGSWGCAGAIGGRTYRGTGVGFGTGSYTWFAGTMINRIDQNTDRWVDAPAPRFQSIHPEAVVTFYSGWSGVGIVYILNNYWTDRMQDQYIDVELRTGSSAGPVVYTKPGIKFAARTRLRFPVWNENDRMYWDGAAPGEVRYDYNHKYKKYAGVIPHDPRVTLSSNAIANELFNNTSTSSVLEPAWEVSDKCAPDDYETLTGTWKRVKGPINRQVPDVGGRPDIGLFPRWMGTAIYSWSSTLANAHRMNEIALSLGACSGMLAYHYREGATGLKFCDNGEYAADPNDKSCVPANRSVDAFGFPVSIDARPTAVTGNQINTQAADRYMPVGYVSNNGFEFNSGTVSHMPSLSFLPYLMTGDYFYEQEVLYLGSHVVANGSEFPEFTLTNTNDRAHQRHRDWGYLAWRDGIRGRAWAFRDLAQAAWVGADGSPVKEYFVSKLNRNIAIDEGKFQVTDGYFHQPCPEPVNNLWDYSPWCFGRYKAMESDLRLTYSQEVPQAYLVGGEVDPQKAFTAQGPWMVAYLFTAIGHAEYLGFRQVRPARTAMMKGLLNRLKHRDYNPFLVGSYREPLTPCFPEGVPQPGGCPSQVLLPGQQFTFSSYLSMKQAHLPVFQTINGFTNDTDLQSGYAQLNRAASSWLADGVTAPPGTGWSAWEWINGNVRYQNLYGDNPHWPFAPRDRIDVRVIPGDTQIRFIGSTISPDSCRLRVASSPFSSWDDGADPGLALVGRSFSTVSAGLTAGTNYYWRITCGPLGGLGRRVGMVTTLSTGGSAVTTALKLTPPPGRGIADALVDYGATSALGSTLTAGCATACSVNLPGSANRALYYRVTYRDGGGATVAVSRIQSLIQ